MISFRHTFLFVFLSFSFSYAEETPPPRSPKIHLLPLKAVTITVLNKLSAEKKDIKIPIGSQLKIGNFVVQPLSCQSIKRLTVKNHDYTVRLLVQNSDTDKKELTLSTEPFAPRTTNEHPIFSVFVKSCHFEELSRNR